MTRSLAWCFSLLLMLWLSLPAMAQQRVALVIGDDAYQSEARLANLVNDATRMAAMLTEMGFRVERVLDATRNQMEQAMARFAAAAKRASACSIW